MHSSRPASGGTPAHSLNCFPHRDAEWGGGGCAGGQAIHEVAERHGYGVVREFVGHGVGRVFHAAPHVMHCRNGEPGVMQVPLMMLLMMHRPHVRQPWRLDGCNVSVRA